jgi:VWFA-related protein
MRRVVISTVLAALLAASGAAQDGQPQRFRGGVDLITIDVSATDSRGRPVEDLKAGDFIVKVDGMPRPIVSAELIKVDRGKPAAPSRPVDSLISTNEVPQNARRIIVAVDQTLITPGMITPLLQTGAQFVDRLAPSDYAAFLAFPEPGPRVEFTTDKSLVRNAMQRIVGQPGRIRATDLDIALWEAFTITGPESIRNSTRAPGGPAPGPIMTAVADRECAADEDRTICEQRIYQESLRIASEARIEATISLRALEAYLTELVPLEGPKSMVIFSAGIITEEPSQVDRIARLAAAARTSIHVIAVDRDTDRMLNSESAPPPRSLQDRTYELAGLETIVDRTGGTLFRGIAKGAGVFEELESTLSAWYVLAVQRRPDDPERQQLDVEIKRRGVTARSNKTAINTRANTQRPLDELLSDALSSPMAIPGVPLAVTTFTQRDAPGDKYRLRVAAQIGAPGEPGGEFALGYMLTDTRGRVLTTAGSRRTLSPAATGPNQRLQYDTALAIAPGSYVLRFGVVDKDGRRGTVVHRFELPKFEDVSVPTSDLIVGNLPAEGEVLSPRVDPQVTTSELAGYLELYLSEAAVGKVTVTLEIAEGESSPPLASSVLALRAGDTPSTSVATGFVQATMTPGKYLARTTVRRDGAVVKTISRPFTLVRDAAVVSTATTRSKGVAITPELQRRTAAYVAGVVNGLGNIVAQEDFTLGSPNRKVQSDLLLVRYPGTQRDLIPYRDVSHLNGKALAGREQRLIDLFVMPTDRLRDLARRIMASADAYVPSAFNPIFVIGFMQADFQSRFNLTVGDAGPDWPRAVKAVSFVEVGRPTLLRTGAFGNLDAPTQGTAWIEEGTGRILQTELQIGRGKNAPTMITKFKLDDRLQVMVPIEMQTKNPDGMATYSNFRRFEVATNSAVQPPPLSPK